MFSYQHVVVTGGGTGLGKALVQGIFTRGAIVTMVGKDEEKLEQLCYKTEVILEAVQDCSDYEEEQGKLNKVSCVIMMSDHPKTPETMTVLMFKCSTMFQ